jgi:hypothetical protein
MIDAYELLRIKESDLARIQGKSSRCGLSRRCSRRQRRRRFCRGMRMKGEWSPKSTVRTTTKMPSITSLFPTLPQSCSR